MTGKQSNRLFWTIAATVCAIGAGGFAKPSVSRADGKPFSMGDFRKIIDMFLMGQKVAASAFSISVKGRPAPEEHWAKCAEKFKKRLEVHFMEKANWRAADHSDLLKKWHIVDSPISGTESGRCKTDTSYRPEYPAYAGQPERGNAQCRMKLCEKP